MKLRPAFIVVTEPGYVQDIQRSFVSNACRDARNNVRIAGLVATLLQRQLLRQY